MLVMGMGNGGDNGEVSDGEAFEDDVNAAVKNLRPKESRLNDADLKPFLSGFPDCKIFIGFSAFIFFQSAVFGDL